MKAQHGMALHSTTQHNQHCFIVHLILEVALLVATHGKEGVHDPLLLPPLPLDYHKHHLHHIRLLLHRLICWQRGRVVQPDEPAGIQLTVGISCRVQARKLSESAVPTKASCSLRMCLLLHRLICWQRVVAVTCRCAAEPIIFHVGLEVCTR